MTSKKFGTRIFHSSSESQTGLTNFIVVFLLIYLLLLDLNLACSVGVWQDIYLQIMNSNTMSHQFLPFQPIAAILHLIIKWSESTQCKNNSSQDNWFHQMQPTHRILRFQIQVLWIKHCLSGHSETFVTDNIEDIW